MLLIFLIFESSKSDNSREDHRPAFIKLLMNPHMLAEQAEPVICHVNTLLCHKVVDVSDKPNDDDETLKCNLHPGGWNQKSYLYQDCDKDIREGKIKITTEI